MIGITRSPHRKMTGKPVAMTGVKLDLSFPASPRQRQHLVELGIKDAGFDLTEADAAELINRAYNAKRQREHLSEA